MPVYAIALVLFYYDQRVRQEGFDIEMLMRQAGMDAEPPVLVEDGSGETGGTGSSTDLTADKQVGEPPSGPEPAVVKSGSVDTSTTELA
jgi:hypothetical protein